MVPMETHSHTRLDREADRQAMPGAVRWAVFAVVGLALVGALYLVAVRGEALLLDLSALGRIFCF
jgi:hypothetical protein